MRDFRWSPEYVDRVITSAQGWVWYNWLKAQEREQAKWLKTTTNTD